MSSTSRTLSSTKRPGRHRSPPPLARPLPCDFPLDLARRGSTPLPHDPLPGISWCRHKCRRTGCDEPTNTIRERREERPPSCSEEPTALRHATESSTSSWSPPESTQHELRRNCLEEEQLAETLRKKPLPHQEEMDILFGSTETQDGNMFCAGGIGDRTPSDGSDDNPPLVSDDNVGRSSVGRATRRSGKEQVVDSPPPKRTKSVEYYVQRISESMLERSRNESSSKSREQDEVKELLRVVEEDGVG